MTSRTGTAAAWWTPRRPTSRRCEAGRRSIRAFDRLQSAVRVYGETAVVTGTATLSLRGQAAPFTLRYTLVYVLRDRQWRMVAWQSTRLP